MTLLLNTENGQKPAPNWNEVPFCATADQITNGLLECPELEKYYYEKYESEAKAYEIQCLTSH